MAPPEELAPGYVYLIEGPGGLFKIGHSVNPFTRLAQIAPRSAGLELRHYIPSADRVWLERFLHEAYSHRRVKGEWFHLSLADVEDFRTIGEADHLDQLPSWVVAKRVLNEAGGFQWGERNDSALVHTVSPDGFARQTLYTDKATFDALSAYLANQPQHKRAKKRDVIESALHLLLAQEGFWPWPPADPDGKPKK